MSDSKGNHHHTNGSHDATGDSVANALRGVCHAEPDQQQPRHALEPLTERFEDLAPEPERQEPSSTDTVTWPKPHTAVMPAVRRADQRFARASAANGIQ